MNIWIIIYLSIGALVGIPLARNYWKEFRMSNHKANVIMPLKFQNRTIDSFVFMVAWMYFIPFYPIALIELLIKRIKNRKGETI
jgi:hypothetical protein